MTRLLASAWVIARRDYVATVWSRTFLIFLAAPMLPLVMAALLSLFSASDDGGHRSRDSGVALVADGHTVQALTRARESLAARLGPEALPAFDTGHAPGFEQPVVRGTLDHPSLSGPAGAVDDLKGPIALIVDQARAARALGGKTPPPVTLDTQVTAAATQPDRSDVAHGGQLALFFLTILLAGMMISNMAEEKSNKVIELLTAAVPVDAIFFGKLLAILGASLTGLVVWGTMAAIAASTLLPAHAVAAPAMGWLPFLALGLAYFVTVFLLWGAVYLGIGAQAGSAREAQTLSMPLTLGEAMAFILASSQVGHPASPLGLVAAIVPWSSPFAMIGRAATDTALWPHFLALGWQIAAIAFTVRTGAALFRRNILKSGRSASTLSKRWFGR